MRELASGPAATVASEPAAADRVQVAAPAATVLRLQSAAGNAAVARLLAREIADVDAAPTAFDIEPDAPAFNERLFKRKDYLTIGFMQRIQAFLDAPVSSSWSGTALRDLAFRVSEWQAAHGVGMTGKLDEGTLKEMSGAGLPLKGASTAAFVGKLDDRDREELSREKSEAAQHAGGSSDEQRAAIVRLAEQQVGRVHSGDRGDGRKYGWIRLHDYYRVALPTFNEQELLEGIKAAAKFPGQHYNAQTKEWSSKAGAWSWCGIFALWAVKTVTGRGSWERQPIGFDSHADVANAQPGDVIHRIDDPNNQLNHHCLVKAVEGNQVTTINGNGDSQQNHVRTEPLSKYDRYWDVMSTAAAKSGSVKASP
jgi:hypothetical protein